MNKQRVGSNRLLARRLAKELSAEELRSIGGQGTSYQGTLGCVDGKGGDVRAIDCTENDDTFSC